MSEIDGQASEATTPAERIAMMWQLAVDAWTRAGRELPRYTRADIPATLYRPGTTPEDDDFDGTI